MAHKQMETSRAGRIDGPARLCIEKAHPRRAKWDVKPAIRPFDRRMFRHRMEQMPPCKADILRVASYRVEAYIRLGLMTALLSRHWLIRGVREGRNGSKKQVRSAFSLINLISWSSLVE